MIKFVIAALLAYRTAGDECNNAAIIPLGFPTEQSLPSDAAGFQGAKFNVQIAGVTQALAIENSPQGVGVVIESNIVARLDGPSATTLTVTDIEEPEMKCEMEIRQFSIADKFFYVSNNSRVAFYNEATQMTGGSVQQNEYYRDVLTQIHLNPQAVEGIPTGANWFRIRDGYPTDLTSEPTEANRNIDGDYPYKKPVAKGLATREELDKLGVYWGNMTYYLSNGIPTEEYVIREFWVVDDDSGRPRVEGSKRLPFGTNMVATFRESTTEPNIWADIGWRDAASREARVMSKNPIDYSLVNPDLPEPVAVEPWYPAAIPIAVFEAAWAVTSAIAAGWVIVIVVL